MQAKSFSESKISNLKSKISSVRLLIQRQQFFLADLARIEPGGPLLGRLARELRQLQRIDAQTAQRRRQARLGQQPRDKIRQPFHAASQLGQRAAVLRLMQ